MRAIVAVGCLCACSAKEAPPAPTAPVHLDAGVAAWPSPDCDKLLSARDIAELCHVPALTEHANPDEGTVKAAYSSNPAEKILCDRDLQLAPRGKTGAFLLTAYPDAAWPKQLAKLFHVAYGAVSLKQQATAAFTRRDLTGYVGRYQWNLFETDEKGEPKLCTDEQWQALAQRLVDRLGQAL